MNNDIDDLDTEPELDAEDRPVDHTRYRALQAENLRLERKVAQLVGHLARQEAPLADVCTAYETELSRWKSVAVKNKDANRHLRNEVRRLKANEERRLKEAAKRSDLQGTCTRGMLGDKETNDER